MNHRILSLLLCLIPYATTCMHSTKKAIYEQKMREACNYLIALSAWKQNNLQQIMPENVANEIRMISVLLKSPYGKKISKL